MVGHRPLTAETGVQFPLGLQNILDSPTGESKNFIVSRWELKEARTPPVRVRAPGFGGEAKAAEEKNSPRLKKFSRSQF